MSDPTSSQTPGGISLASAAGLCRALTAAENPSKTLAATMQFLQTWGPRIARLVALHADEAGRPKIGQTLSEWRAGQLISDSPDYTVLHPIADFPLVAAWDGKLLAPVFFADLEQDERVDEKLRQQTRAAGYQAAVLIPIFHASYGGWQGVLKIFWEGPHSFSAEEQELCQLLMSVLSSHLGGLSSQQRLGAALADLELLQSISKQFNTAQTLEEALHALTLAAPDREHAEVTLCSIENNAEGQPVWLTVMNTWPTTLNLPGVSLGARFHLPEIPLATLYLSSPDVPLLISDVQQDPRVDPYARNLYALSGVRSTIIMALTVQGRWVGLINITWRHVVTLGQREERLYLALAKHAALRLDNSLMVERLRASLEETRQQGAVLRTVLDTIPIGLLFTEAPSGKPLLSNPAAARLLGREPDPHGLPEQYAKLYSMVRPNGEEELPAEALPSVRAMSTGKTHTAEVDILHPNRERTHLELLGAPMFDASGAVQNCLLLLQDVTERKRADKARRLQEQAMRVQAEALVELSSPLIPITNDILVLPIIGAIDTERGQQVLSTVLHGTSQSRARVAILDITGVRTVDTQAAAALTNAAQALRLLGVEPVLTGIKPEVAQTLVGLGVRLGGIVTRSTLQAGIQYALRHLGKTLLD